MIHIERLTKRFDASHGIFDVSLTVERGTVFGFIGPNGAGKSTAIRHLMGLLHADSGKATIMGYDCWRESETVKAHVGYLPGEINYPQDMTGEEIIRLTSRLHETSLERETHLRQIFAFDTTLKVRKMSKGMKQKLAIVTCFMKDAPVYLLDEPTSGLDPLMQERLVEWVLAEKAAGKAILMSSHHFPEMEKTCDRAALIRDGRIIIESEMNELKRRSVKTYQVGLKSETDAGLLAARIGTRDGRNVDVSISSPEELNVFLATLTQFEVESLTSGADELEQMFMQYYGEAT
ncbi:ATP-binding cassette domain-containing protein [Exiguobacterium sp.]|uniref:ABC transporter ATP-binding protein n=1 Tax=Exiguobacterium sp. TaxID=44751 RepID=UPI00263ABEC0|nr:ATP-binding cassette domain-containing protein [Exiguobacterium sp.]MCC5893486.1 ATP-binding cassette domain-containing protein [Exiguobacterium sp.]